MTHPPAPLLPSVDAAPLAETKGAIMDAAERLFAEQGLDATSVRDITKAAGVNLGAINYHFGTKDGLIVAVFARRLTPLNEARLARLDAVEGRHGANVPPLEEVLDALIRPTVEYQESERQKGESFMRLMCRCFQEPNAGLTTLMLDQFGELVRRFDGAVLRALPGLPPEELFWQINFMFGSLHHAVDTWVRFETNPFARMPGSPAAKPLSREELVQRLVAFAAAGLRASQKP